MKSCWVEMVPKTHHCFEIHLNRKENNHVANPENQTQGFSL